LSKSEVSPRLKPVVLRRRIQDLKAPAPSVGNNGLGRIENVSRSDS
jgi:hypothetical protein